MPDRYVSLRKPLRQCKRIHIGLVMTNVLFLCTGNSARSILSEVLLRDFGEGRFGAFSAGSRPSGVPHPDGLAELIRKGHAPGEVSSKSWDVFSGPDAPLMDIIVTVCSSAAGETCPIWPVKDGQSPLRVHWGADDPAHVEPLSARQKAFSEVYELCKLRIEALIALPEGELRNKDALQLIGDISI